MKENAGSLYVRQYQNRQAARAMQARQRQEDDDIADDLTVADAEDEWYPRMPKSALRIRDARAEPDASVPSSRNVVVHRVRRRTSAFTGKETEELPRLRDRHRLHPLVFVGVALLIMVCGYWLFTLAANWWTTTTNTWSYGYPRTYQCDAVVGHNHDSVANPSHFIALNLNGKVEVIEIPAGNASQAKIYVGPTLIGANPNLAPVTLRFADVTGDGRLDMIIQVQGGQFVFVNTGTQFHPATPADHVTLPTS